MDYGMYGQSVARCKGCGRQIIWTKMQSGKAMPCDPEIIRFVPGKGGEVFITPEGLAKHGERTGIEESLMGYISHWATCTARDKFKKRGA